MRTCDLCCWNWWYGANYWFLRSRVLVSFRFILLFIFAYKLVIWGWERVICVVETGDVVQISDYNDRVFIIRCFSFNWSDCWIQVLVSSKEEVDAVLSPAMVAVMRLSRRINELPEGDEDDIETSPVSCCVRLLVPSGQAYSLIGRQGLIVKSMQEASGAAIQVFSRGICFVWKLCRVFNSL